MMGNHAHADAPVSLEHVQSGLRPCDLFPLKHNPVQSSGCLRTEKLLTASFRLNTTIYLVKIQVVTVFLFCFCARLCITPIMIIFIYIYVVYLSHRYMLYFSYITVWSSSSFTSNGLWFFYDYYCGSFSIYRTNVLNVDIFKMYPQEK